jgi:hypothetical protein
LLEPVRHQHGTLAVVYFDACGNECAAGVEF